MHGMRRAKKDGAQAADSLDKQKRLRIDYHVGKTRRMVKMNLDTVRETINGLYRMSSR